MEMPANWQSLPVDKVASVNGRIIGSEPIGGSVAVNSLAVVREYQGKGVGRALTNTFIRYIRSGGVAAERIVIIAHDYLIKFHESFGFESEGESECLFGGGGWYDMVRFTFSFFSPLSWERRLG
jgi:L-amino acid N-acyltransferase YncA